MSQLARRYAKALLELATEQNQVDQIGRDLDDLAETWKGSSDELGRVFESPEVGADQRREVIDALATRMGLSPVVKQTLYLLSDRRRMRFVPEVAHAFAKLEQERSGKRTAEVTTAVPMPDAFYRQIQVTIEKNTGLSIVLEKKQDPSIIGGVITRLGDRVYDGSLKTRLSELGDRLLNR